jgi:valyl-tRNA synthetase
MGAMRALVPMAGLIDPQAEVTRLEKRIAKTHDEIKRATAKLSNENFVRNAPPEVVEQERGRIKDFERTLASLDAQLTRVRQLL